MIKSFSGLVVFCFAFLRTISAYVGENWLSQYSLIGYIISGRMPQNTYNNALVICKHNPPIMVEGEE